MRNRSSLYPKKSIRQPPALVPVSLGQVGVRETLFVSVLTAPATAGLLLRRLPRVYVN